MNVIGDAGHINISGEFAPDSNVTVKFSGPNNRLEIGPNVKFTAGIIEFRQSGQTVRLAGDNRLAGSFHLIGLGASIVIGRRTKTNAHLWMSVAEAGDRVDIGEDCLFFNVRFRTSDSHRLLDLTTGERLNPSAPIVIEDKVWIAEDALILKGAVIGRGSVIGARSLVRGVIPANCVAAGVPARVIRENIRWEE